MSIRIDNAKDELRAHLCSRLMEMGIGLRRDGVLPVADVATAFVMTGATIAVCHDGEGATAEWLRDLADMIERADKTLNGTVH